MKGKFASHVIVWVRTGTSTRKDNATSFIVKFSRQPTINVLQKYCTDTNVSDVKMIYCCICDLHLKS